MTKQEIEYNIQQGRITYGQGYPCPTANYRMAQGWCLAKADYMRQVAERMEEQEQAS